jgi:steroid 5-alpha reductase family enzyme
LAYSAYRKYAEEGGCDRRSKRMKKKYGTKLALRRDFLVLVLILLLSYYYQNY